MIIEVRTLRKLSMNVILYLCIVTLKTYDSVRLPLNSPYHPTTRVVFCLTLVTLFRSLGTFSSFSKTFPLFLFQILSTPTIKRNSN